MITAVGIGLVGAGLMMVYAGVTGQSLRAELAAAFGRAGAPGFNVEAAAALAGGGVPTVAQGPATGPPTTDTGNITRGLQ